MTTLERVIQEFLSDGKARGLSPRTQRWYRLTLQQFTTYAAHQGATGLDALQVGLVRLYLGECMSRMSPGGVHARMRAVRALCGFLRTEELLVANPFDKVKLPKVPDRDLDVVTDAAYRALMAAGALGRHPLRDQAIFSLLFDTGVRATELCSIHLGDVSRAEGGIIIRHGKGGKQRFVPASRPVLKRLSQYQTHERPSSEHPHLFLSSVDHPLGYDTLRAILERHCKTANVKPVRPHAFRRGFAVAYVRNGGDVFTLQRILGHTTLAMSSRYARMNTSDVKDVHARVSPVARSHAR